MGNNYGAGSFPDLFRGCVLWAPLSHSAAISGDFDEFPIIPSGVTVTNNPVSSGWTKDDLGNNKSVMRFDGSTNNISLTDNDAWNFGSGDFSMCLWVKFTSLTNTNGTMALIFQHISTSRSCALLYNCNPARIDFNHSTDGTTDIGNALNWTPSISTWYHIGCIRSGTSVLVYINGILLGTIATIGTSTIFNSTYPLFIGSADTANSFDLNGNIKDLLIYKGRALTVPEIKLLMNRTHPITGLGLMPANGKYWRLT